MTMPNLLQYGSEPAIELDDSLIWTDEFDWTPVDQETEYSVTGSLIRDEMAKAEGRPMTLVSGDDWGWVSRQVIEQLAALTRIANGRFALTYRGQAYTVAFDQANKALQAQQVQPSADPDASDMYSFTLRFLILEE